MKKVVVFGFLLASFAFAQRQSIVVLPSVDLDSKLTPKQKELLVDEVRTIASKLPSASFFLMKQDEVNEQLGDEAVSTACEEGTCVGNLIKKLSANFGARCDVSSVDGKLYLKFELYGTLRGQSEPQTVDQFNEPVKNFAEMQALIRKKVPAIFDIIVKSKSPQETCESAGNAWINGACVTSTQIAKESCESEGKTWIGGACKSREQIACEASGKKWVGEECKTAEQIACENKGDVWVNGVCRSQVAVPIPAPTAPAAGGDYVSAQIVTEPAGASLSLNGAPYPGCLKTPCPISLYRENRVNLSVALSEHETADTTVTITIPGQLVTIKLKPKTYYVNFSSEPSGASLALEDDQTSYKCETPCNVSLKKGRVKVSAGSDAYYDRKDTTISVTGESGQRINLKLSPNFGTVDIKGASDYGWNLSVGDKHIPINNIRLFSGSYNAKLTHDDYEDIDLSVEIKKNEHKVFDISDKVVHKFGFLDIEPAYSEGIGKDESWVLSIGGEHSSFGEVKLLHGDYVLKLTHSCYEDIAAEVKVGRGEKINFDMPGKLALKQSTLVLRSKRKVRNLSKPVIVNGRKVGETPFEGSVPLCSEIKIGKDEEVVHVKLEHNKPVEYVHRETTTKSHVLGAVIDAVGAGLLFFSYKAFEDRDRDYDYYASITQQPNGQKLPPYYYDEAWKNVKSSHSMGNTSLIIGSAILALGIGVHIWF